MSNKCLSVDKEMLRTARKQFCLDIGLDFEAYLANPNEKCYICKAKYTPGTCSPAAEGARCYDGKDSFFKAIICMGQLFLAVDEDIYDWAVETFSDCQPQWFCEYGNLRMIDRKLQEYGREIADTHVYFLPAQEQPDVGKCEFPLQWFEQEDILQFKEKNQFTSALSFWNNQPDMLAVAALKKADVSAETEEKQGSESQVRASDCSEEHPQEKMAGMAGVSRDGEFLWQIGINVRKEYAGKGLAVQLVTEMKQEVIRRGKVPFYGTSESHIISQTVGLKAGFAPAWTEIYVRTIEK